MSESNKTTPLVIQCPNPDCGNTDVDSDILLCEHLPTTWGFKVEGHSLVAKSMTENSCDYLESTRHLLCTCCGTEWKVPTNATVSWK